MGAPGTRPGGKAGRRCVKCRTPLASDNTARMCGRCTREQRDQLDAPIPYSDEFFDTDDFRAAFESRSMGRIFKVYRNHPRHLHIYGKALNQETLARWLHITQVHVSRIESDKVVLSQEDAIEYARKLHLPQRFFWILYPGESWPIEHPSGLIVPEAAQELVVALDSNMTREQARISSIVNGSNRTDAVAIDAVAVVLGNLRRLEDATSAGTVLPTVLQQAALVTELANNADGEVRNKAVGLLSEFHQYSGWLHIPDKEWGRAQSHLDRASILAMEVDDPHRLSTALSFMSYKNLRLDHVGAAAALNEAASRDSRLDIGLRTYLAFQRAELLARGGDRAQALEVLREADRLVESLPPEDQLSDSTYWYTSAFFHGSRAFVLKALGDSGQAKRIAAEAIQMLPGTWRDSEWASRRRKLAEID